MRKCFNHPDRDAKRTCFECKKPICPECQYRADHHIFCGEDCHQRWLSKSRELKKQRDSQKAEPSARIKLGILETKLDEITGEQIKLEQKLKQLEADRGKTRKFLLLSGLLGLVVLVVFLGISGYFWSLEQKHSRASEPSPKRSTAQYDPGYPGTLSENVPLEAPMLELPPGEIKVQASKIDLYGWAPSAQRVLLLINGRERMSVSLSKPGFVFKEVELGEGSNLIQVLSEDGKGNQSYSIAQLINYSRSGQAVVAYTPGLDYTHGPRDFSGIALTFDAGGEQGYAERMLEILRETGVRTTIFVTGQFIKAYPALVRQMVEDGHEIGNHTYSHPHLTTWEQNFHQWTAPGVTRELVQAELLNTARIFKETTGAEMARFWRAPYGEHNREIRKWAEEVGFYHISWSRSATTSYDTRDWLCDPNSKYYQSDEEIRAMLIEIAQNNLTDAQGAILLMHLSTARGERFPDQVLAPALQAFLATGSKIVKVSELFPGLVGK